MSGEYAGQASFFGDTMENVLVAGGFEGLAVVGRPYATKGGYRWRFSERRHE